MKIILVHGWDGGPDKNWLPWLRKELEAQRHEVLAPLLPITEEPRIERWVPALAETVGTLDGNTYFVAHSMGNQATLRYLETLPEKVKIGGALFVAGFLNPLVNLEGPKEEEIAHSWTDAPFDLARARSHIPKSIALFSDDDEWVTLDNAERFRSELGSEIIIAHKREHFTEDEEPDVRAAILKLLGA